LNNTGGTGTSATFNTYVVEWNTGTNTAVGGTWQAFDASNVGITSSTAGINNLTFTDSWTAVSPTTTYALVLSYTNGSPLFAATTGANPNDAFFGSGGAGIANTSAFGDVTAFQNYLQSNATTPNTGQAFTMSVDGTLAPVPEPKTAAAGLAALFVAALVGRRVWQRRKAATAPLAA
jgi:hypothetical protein